MTVHTTLLLMRKLRGGGTGTPATIYEYVTLISDITRSKLAGHANYSVCLAGESSMSRLLALSNSSELAGYANYAARLMSHTPQATLIGADNESELHGFPNYPVKLVRK